MFEISIIIPTYNEEENIIDLIKEVQQVCDGLDHEIIVVDDNSPDRTHAKVKDYGKQFQNVFCINRTWKKGLSSAVVEGAALASKKYICVMDGDGQHDPNDIIKMINQVKKRNLDIVIGSRFHDQQNTNAFSKGRNYLSKIGIKITNFFTRIKCSDPLSGLFLIEKDKFRDVQKSLYKDGFKILFDILMLSKHLNHAEIQINFRQRVKGESKLNISTVFNLGGQIIENLTKGLIPANFLVFAMVGSFGVIIHLTVLNIALLLNLNFIPSNVFATVVAMTCNYFLNNYLTFHNMHKSFIERFKGAVKYFLANSFSIIANIGVASQLYLNDFTAMSSALFGILAGLILNYFMSVNLVFKK